jgi:hypothetical protein
LIIKSGNISVTAAGDGIAAQANLTISDGSFTIITGYFTIATGDDAIHADASITINGGYVAVNCTTGDGLDSNGNLYINGGTLRKTFTLSAKITSVTI